MFFFTLLFWATACLSEPVSQITLLRLASCPQLSRDRDLTLYDPASGQALAALRQVAFADHHMAAVSMPHLWRKWAIPTGLTDEALRGFLVGSRQDVGAALCAPEVCLLQPQVVNPLLRVV